MFLRNINKKVLYNLHSILTKNLHLVTATLSLAALLHHLSATCTCKNYVPSLSSTTASAPACPEHLRMLLLLPLIIHLLILRILPMICSSQSPAPAPAPHHSHVPDPLHTTAPAPWSELLQPFLFVIFLPLPFVILLPYSLCFLKPFK